MTIDAASTRAGSDAIVKMLSRHADGSSTDLTPRQTTTLLQDWQEESGLSSPTALPTRFRPDG